MSNTVESLPASWYYDTEIFLAEQSQIFAKNWTFVSHSGALDQPGQYVTSNIANQSIVVVRTFDNRLTGFLNLCRHRASTLCTEDNGSLTQFTCPYHAWSYNLNGNLKNAPGFELGKDLNSDEFSLIPIKVEVWNDLVFACLDLEGISVLDWLGDIVEISENFPKVAEMEFHAMRSNHFAVNWKNYSDNSAEGYHLPTIHPGLNASVVSKQTEIKPYENGKFVGFDITYKDDNAPGFWIYKFPGLLLHFSTDTFNVERVIPGGAKETILQRWFWFKSTVDKVQRDETLAFSNQVMEEDVGICTRVQKNLEGGYYQTGILSKQREPGTIFFQQCVREALANSVSVNSTRN